MQSIPPVMYTPRPMQPAGSPMRFAGQPLTDARFQQLRGQVERLTKARGQVVSHAHGRYIQFVTVNDAERDRMVNALKRRGATEIPLTEFDDMIPQGTVRLDYKGLKIQFFPMGDPKDWEYMVFS